MHVYQWGLTGLTVLALAMSGLSTATASEVITIGGSTTCYPIVSEAAKAFEAKHPGVRLVVGVGGSNVGIKNTGEGAIDIGNVSRDLKTSDVESYPDLVKTTIGLDGVAIIVPLSNPLNEITRDQVQKIYLGEINNWKQLGGEDKPIDVVGILLSHGTATVFMDYFGLAADEEGEGAGKVLRYRLKDGGTPAPITAKAADGNKYSCAAVMTKRNAIGFCSVATAETLADKDAPIKLLALDGVPASRKTVAAGDYKLSRQLNMVTKGEPTGRVKEFIDFILGDEGREIVQRNGYTPASQ